MDERVRILEERVKTLQIDIKSHRARIAQLVEERDRWRSTAEANADLLQQAHQRLQSLQGGLEEIRTQDTLTQEKGVHVPLYGFFGRMANNILEGRR
jgi:chromosome segregation ATPase